MLFVLKTFNGKESLICSYKLIQKMLIVKTVYILLSKIIKKTGLPLLKDLINKIYR